jgi:hypothetical protein
LQASLQRWSLSERPQLALIRECVDDKTRSEGRQTMPMEAKDIFEAQSRSLRELLSENGLGLYLPPYQRPYSWSRDKVEKLLDDTLHGLQALLKSSDSFTFLGTIITIHDINNVTVHPIVKNEVPAKVLTVIDGQQRISTLLMLTACLHNSIRQRHWKLFRGKVPDVQNLALTALHEETVILLNTIGTVFYEKQNIGDSPLYPRLIRAFKDTWAKKKNLREYESPIAHLLHTYASIVEDERESPLKPTDFRPKPREGVGDGEIDLVRRYSETRSLLADLAAGKQTEGFEQLPELTLVANSVEVQRSLFNHPLEEALVDLIDGTTDQDVTELVRLLVLASYVLNRIALTVVKGKDEDYAFTIFESLNTTGEPLTAYETFLPRVVMAEGLGKYQSSPAYGLMATVDEYLAQFLVGDQIQGATRELMIKFALAETGTKLSKRLADQRSYLKDEFDRWKDSETDRLAFLDHMSTTASFVKDTWVRPSQYPALTGLEPVAMTDAVRLCLAFLVDLNHTIAVSPLVRFYSSALHAVGDERTQRLKDFEEAIKAITAFTIFWRASRRGTGNIDSEYRDVMAGSTLTGMGPLARFRRKGSSGEAPSVDVSFFKAELRRRLIDPQHGDIASPEAWVARSSTIPIYAVSRPVTRFLLLAAYHDSIEDSAHPGLITEGKPGVAPSLTLSGWENETSLTIEHIAPQTRTAGWDLGFYEDREIIHRIGNLVLVPGAANSSLSSRPWQEKRYLYGALGAKSQEEARERLSEAQDKGMTFAQSTEELAQLSNHVPHLASLFQRSDEWDPAFIDIRGACVLERAHQQLGPWLGL